jgi:hypothetical protein
VFPTGDRGLSKRGVTNRGVLNMDVSNKTRYRGLSKRGVPNRGVANWGVFKKGSSKEEVIQMAYSVSNRKHCKYRML